MSYCSKWAPTESSLVVSTLPGVSKSTRTDDWNKQVTQGASITCAKWAHCPTPNRFICLNLRERALASLLELLANNDVQARVQSHACFSECDRVFVPDKVHSPLSGNYFPATALALPSAAEFTSQSSKSGSHKKNRRHTTSNEHVSAANVSAENRSVDKPAGPNRVNCDTRKISRPQRSRRCPPYPGEVRWTCFCLARPFASLLKSNNCLLFTRLTSARRYTQGCVQQT